MKKKQSLPDSFLKTMELCVKKQKTVKTTVKEYYYKNKNYKNVKKSET